MLNSMTGFSQVAGEVRGFKFRLEARSLNHRFLEIKTKLPGMLFGIEPEIEKLAQVYFERGKIENQLTIEAEPEDLTLKWNRPRARAYLTALTELKNELGLSGDVSLELLINQKDAIIFETEKWGKESWKELEPLFRNCFEELALSRREEGERLFQDLKKRTARIKELLFEIQSQENKLLVEIKNRLQKKIEKLNLEKLEIDAGRLEQEIALIATRSDISEETERIASHLKQFEQELNTKGAKGKKLEFLTQELNREFNTLSAKVQNSELSYLSIEAKTELERIRQQLQNIE